MEVDEGTVVLEGEEMPSEPPPEDPEDVKAGESVKKLREELFRASVVNTFIEIDWDGEWYLATVREYLQGSDRSASPGPGPVGAGSVSSGGRDGGGSSGDSGGNSSSGVGWEPPPPLLAGPHLVVLYGTGEEEQMLLRSDGTAAGGHDGTDTINWRRTDKTFEVPGDSDDDDDDEDDEDDDDDDEGRMALLGGGSEGQKKRKRAPKRSLAGTRAKGLGGSASDQRDVYYSLDDETARVIARKLGVDMQLLVALNVQRYAGLGPSAKLQELTTLILPNERDMQNKAEILAR